jgi:hypothetical protein
MGKYKIKKGNHFSGFHIGFTFSNKVSYRCMFEASCIYDLKSNDNYDINKLCGFSTTYNHHYQSGRIGWRCVDGKSIDIVTYTYNNHERLTEVLLGNVTPNEEFECSIEDVEDAYIYTFKSYVGNINLDDVVVRTPKQPDKVLFKYLLYPYFGGNMPAPHEMKLRVKRL